MTTAHQTTTDLILDSDLPPNEKIQSLRVQRRILRAAIANMQGSESCEPGERFYPVLSGMQTELDVLEVGMSRCYDLMIAANA